MKLFIYTLNIFALCCVLADSDHKSSTQENDSWFKWYHIPLAPRGTKQFLHFMMTSSKGNISVLLAMCAATGEFPAQRPVLRSFDVFFDLHPNKRLSKQSWGWWFETPSCPLWRHCNVIPSVWASNWDVNPWMPFVFYGVVFLFSDILFHLFGYLLFQLRT